MSVEGRAGIPPRRALALVVNRSLTDRSRLSVSWGRKRPANPTKIRYIRADEDMWKRPTRALHDACFRMLEPTCPSRFYVPFGRGSPRLATCPPPASV